MFSTRHLLSLISVAYHLFSRLEDLILQLSSATEGLLGIILNVPLPDYIAEVNDHTRSLINVQRSALRLAACRNLLSLLVGSGGSL